MDQEDNTSLWEKQPVNLNDYTIAYQQSLEQREMFWTIQTKRLIWDKEFTSVVSEDLIGRNISWFEDGMLNASKNALDINIEHGKGAQPALIYFSLGEPRTYTYNELFKEVTAISSSLVHEGLKRGDRVALYLPDCPESIVVILACARLGMTSVPIPSHFTSEITLEILRDCGASLLITAFCPEIPSFNERARNIIKSGNNIKIIVVGNEVPDSATSYSSLYEQGSRNPHSSYLPVKAEHPLFILYAHSSAGIPRGSVFATGGFCVQSAMSFKNIFQRTPDKNSVHPIVCTVALASSAGQCYGLWGSLLNGGTSIITQRGEDITLHDVEQIVTSVPQSQLITTPRTLTNLKHEMNDKPLPIGQTFSLVAVCGDVVTPRLISFAGNTLTNGPENVLNLWMQSESGTALIHSFPLKELNRPGALGLPSYGISLTALNHIGEQCKPNESGQLVFSSSWPSMIRTIWGQPERFKEFYFQRFPGYFVTNDGIRIDNDGFIWFMGRLDDVIKVRGQSLATSEIEAVLIAHHRVSEAVVVSVPSETGDELIAFLVPNDISDGREDSPDIQSLKSELTSSIVSRIGEFALPSRFIVARELPHTRTGKVVRRVLRRIALGDISHDEDLSHVSNPQAVIELIRKKEQ